MVSPTTLIVFSAAAIVHGSHAVGASEVKMFSMQRGLHTVPSTTTFLRHNFSRPDDVLTDFTVCYWIRIEKFLRTEVHLSYAISDTDSNMIVLYSEGNKLYSFIRGKSSSVPNPHPFELFPESWNHVCHVVKEDDYTVLWQGEIFANQRLSAEGEILLNGTLILGQEQDSLSNSFAADQVLCGDIAQVNIWSYPLSVPEITAMAECVNPGSGDVFSLDAVDLEVFGNVRQSTVQLTQLCRTPSKFQILPEHKTFDDSFLTCQLLGLALTVPANEKENAQLFSELLPSIDRCSPNVWKLWISISDILDEGVWLDVSQKKKIEYVNFKPPYPFGGTELNCGAMLEDGFWGDEACNEPKCFTCNQKPADFVNLRGLCFTEEHRTRFRIEGRRDGRAIFRGYYDLIIFWRKESQRWVMGNVLTNSTLAWLEVEDEDEYPIGLAEWVTQDQLCGIPSGSKISLSLSACLPQHFMCSSGECIAMAHRCDLRNNCADGSDEDNCEVVKLSAGYRRHLPPTDPGRTALTIIPTIFIDRFVDVDDISMTIAMQFRIKLQWKDSRITFRHLNTKKKTILTENEVQQLWIPKYQLADVEGGRTEVLNRVVTVSSASTPTWPDHNSVNMDLIYPGDNNSLILDVEHLAKFTCNFELYLYPFDVQRCSFQLRLLAAYENYVQLSGTNRTVTYNRSRVLTMYNVYNIKIGSNDKGQSFNVKFALHRRQGMILLSTFLPSMLLLLVSWSTLFVKLEALNVRAVMALTTLLVLYTLATNTSRILPATSTIKLVDVWFLFIIILLFFNIMLHIFVTEGKFTSFFRVRDSPIRLLRVENKTALPEMPSTSHSIRFLRLYRIVIMPLLLLTFNLIFWIMCLVNSNTSDSGQRD